MASLEKRLQVFRQLPLKAQLAMLAASRENPTLSQNLDYLNALERVHAECVQAATPEQQQAYERAKEFMG